MNKISIAHVTRGRLRLRATANLRSESALNAIKAAILSLKTDVYSVDVNSLTGSILIFHKGAPDFLLRVSVALQSLGFIIIAATPPASAFDQKAWLSFLSLLANEGLGWFIDLVGIGWLGEAFFVLQLAQLTRQVSGGDPASMRRALVFLVEALLRLYLTKPRESSA